MVVDDDGVVVNKILIDDDEDTVESTATGTGTIEKTVAGSASGPRT